MATVDNIKKWVAAGSAWVNSYSFSLDKLRSAALAELLKGEELVRTLNQTNGKQQAIAASSIEVDYKTFVPGQERELIDKLTMWDKFVMSDGIVPSVAKFSVAAGIVGATVFLGGRVGTSDLTIYNGLGQTVHVDVGNTNVDVPPHSSYPTQITISDNFKISAHDKSGALIEEFYPIISSGSKHYVYNVAQAAALYQHEVIYSEYLDHSMDNDGRALGAPRWMHTEADYILEEAPETIKTSSYRTVKHSLMAYSKMNPGAVVNVASGTQDVTKLVSAHAKWDPPNSPHILEWLTIADDLKLNHLIDKRIEQNPEEITALRIVMDRSDSAKDSICGIYTDKAKITPDNAAYNYITTRCMDSGPEKDRLYIAGADRWPDNGWYNFAAAYVHSKAWDWTRAHESYMKSYKDKIGLKDPSALSILRLRRLLTAQGVNVDKSTIEADILAYFEPQIDNINDGGLDEIHMHLHKGELNEAYNLIKDGEGADYYILVAASIGATKEMKDKALAQKADNLSDDAFLVFIGMNLREGKSIKKWESRISSLFENEEIDVNEFIKALRSNDYNGAEKIMRQTSLTTQASLASFAYVFKDNSIPKPWKEMAMHLLYPSERPYIK